MTLSKPSLMHHYRVIRLGLSQHSTRQTQWVVQKFGLRGFRTRSHLVTRHAGLELLAILGFRHALIALGQGRFTELSLAATNR